MRNRVAVERPPAEVAVDAELVRALLREQHPDLCDRPIAFVDEGWDNFTFRLGEDLAVRLPRRALGAELAEHEQRWLPELASRLPLPVPEPVRVGRPADRFRWPWSVVRWIEGSPVDDRGLPAAQAPAIAGMLSALHRQAPPEAPRNRYRGGPLAERRDRIEERLGRIEAPALDRVWAAALAAPAFAGPPTWIHGDLHARNVLARDGRIVGIIDWGDLAAGDPATDLVAAWMLFESPGARDRLLRKCGDGRATRARAAGWAVLLTAALLESGEPAHVRLGRAARRRLAADFPAVREQTRRRDRRSGLF